MYDVGKIIYIGGGNDRDSGLPTNVSEIINFNDAAPAWRPTTSMHFRRRHHNATLLPDGTVLVTGGTQGPGFNDLTPGQPVHAAELWNPVRETWTLLAAEAVDRCYHGTAILLPDATVLSAGGGEGGSDPNVSHREAQIFHPPYLFRGPRPEIQSAPEHVSYGEEFSISVKAEHVGGVSWIRLSSVTHAFNQNQRINLLSFKAHDNTLKLTAPATAEICPPGHYMLFVLSQDGVPSKAKIMRVGSSFPTRREEFRTQFEPLQVHQKAIEATNVGTRITVGLTSTCPYGLGACWGGAHEALKKLDQVAAVDPIPNAEDSTADVYLDHQGLPNLELWPKQFEQIANGSYEFRGIEVAVEGKLRRANGDLQLLEASSGISILLQPLDLGTKVQWDRERKRPKSATPGELRAFAELQSQYNTGQLGTTILVGPLLKIKGQWTLFVRRIAF
jgi:hypothetical protein